MIYTDARCSAGSANWSAPLIVAAVIIGFMHVAGARMAWAQPSFCERGRGPAWDVRAETPELQHLLPDERRAIEVFGHARNSVVQVLVEASTTRPQRGRYGFPGNTFPSRALIGSGFVWDSMGHIVTNAHVVRGATTLEVRFIAERTLTATTTGTITPTVSAELVGGSMWHDLAVLRIDPESALVQFDGAPETVLHPVVVGDSEDLERGQRVYAIGSPFAVALTFSTGRISGLRRHRENDDRVLLYDLIQTDASVNPGNSGGPLLDSLGCVIGVNTLSRSRSGTETLNFAVPVGTVLRVVPKLIESGFYSRPRLGGVGALNGRTKPGVYFMGGIVSGLHVGTEEQADIIQQIGNMRTGPITVRTTDDLWRALDYYEPGEAVTLMVLREGQPEQIAVEVTLSDGPMGGDPYPYPLQLTFPLTW